MPRQKIDPLYRQRVAQACDSCKRRKEKCSGTVPCDQCQTRRKKDGCHYSKYTAPATPYPSVTSTTTHQHNTDEVRILPPSVDVAVSPAEAHVQPNI